MRILRTIFPFITMNFADPAGQIAGEPEPDPTPAPGTTTLDGGSTSPDGKNGAQAPAPAGGQATDGNGAPNPDTQAPPKGQVVSEDDLKKALSWNETPEQKIERLERDLKASSTGGRTVAQILSTIQETLKEQHVDVVLSKDKKEFLGLRPLDGYTPNGKAPTVKYTALPEEVKALFDDDPQKAIDHIVGEVSSAMARVLPTAVKEEIDVVSSEKEALVFQALSEKKDAFGNPAYPDLEKDRPIIMDMINGAPDWLKRAYSEAPDQIVEMVNARVQQTRAHLIATATAQSNSTKKKEEEAQASAMVSPSGSAIATMGSPGSADVAELIAKA